MKKSFHNTRSNFHILLRTFLTGLLECTWNRNQFIDIFELVCDICRQNTVFYTDVVDILKRRRLWRGESQNGTFVTKSGKYEVWWPEDILEIQLNKQKERPFTVVWVKKMKKNSSTRKKSFPKFYILVNSTILHWFLYLKLHSVENSRFLYDSDFAWNQFMLDSCRLIFGRSHFEKSKNRFCRTDS